MTCFSRVVIKIIERCSNIFLDLKKMRKRTLKKLLWNLLKNRILFIVFQHKLPIFFYFVRCFCVHKFLPNSTLLHRVHRWSRRTLELSRKFTRIAEHNIHTCLRWWVVVVEKCGNEWFRALLRAPNLKNCFFFFLLFQLLHSQRILS